MFPQNPIALTLILATNGAKPIAGNTVPDIAAPTGLLHSQGDVIVGSG